MVLNKNFKLIIVSLLSVAVYIQARSLARLGDIRVERTDDEWICDKIECPLNSDRCFVLVSNEAEPSVLKRVNICYDENNKVLKQKNSSSATNPNYHIRQSINFFRNDTTVSSSDTYSLDFDEKQHNLNMQKAMEKEMEMEREIEKLYEEFEEQMQNKMDAMEEHLKNIFGESYENF